MSSIEVDMEKFANLVYDYVKLREFARWIVSMDDDDPESPGRQDRRVTGLNDIINRAKEALGE